MTSPYEDLPSERITHLVPFHHQGTTCPFQSLNGAPAREQDRGLVNHNHPDIYYPELDWQLSRLACQGFVKITGHRVETVPNGRPALAKYELKQAGANFLAQLIDIDIWRRRLDYFRDIAAAFARLADEQIEPAVEQDDTYATPGKGYRDLSRFSELESNRTIQRLDKLRNALPKGIRHSNQDLIRAYAALLNLRAA